MQKILLSVTDPQASWLREEASRTGLGMAEILRRVLDGKIERVALVEDVSERLGLTVDETLKQFTEVATAVSQSRATRVVPDQPKKRGAGLTAEEFTAMKPSEKLRAQREGK